ncbi:nuclear transport factor 2 family protein [Schumannella sp. 10F1B-5-1]|uniref:nuclear transport factor 2 family protein n=1 Tax=Schumannella sp. 10F1B-5-1 TaxID=2590780 RepID=UPI001130BEE0|nr:nuclear transport factor 2 family protein [Schumannella sp. 10F1B-5-1]TPW73605.1 nuclear transport factor 2 family protein [Schumannella sp. 10F1B-5-1]
MTELPAPIQRFIDATNAADSDAFVATFADDAYLEDWGRGFHGHDGARAWNASDNIGKRSRFVVEGAEHDGDEWTVTVTVSGDGYNGTSPIRFTVDGDRISRMLITP